ncbi:acyl-ACP thioesterase domain-containing protein [Virgibacillus sp. FSP13]
MVDWFVYKDRLEKEFGVAWVLTRIRVTIVLTPNWDKEITIETWPLEPGKVEFDRDYLVQDVNGNVIIRTISKWIIMDMHERKIKRFWYQLFNNGCIFPCTNSSFGF